MDDRQAERERKKALRADQALSKEALKAEQKKSTKERLAYLMQQTDIFVHFIRPAEAGSSGAGPSAAASSSGAGASSSADADGEGGTGRRTKKGRMTERQEDELMLAAAQQEADQQKEAEQKKLTAQPSCIVNGTMRGYQVEGLNWLLKLREHSVNGILAD